MIKRTVEISQEPYHLAVQLDQLKLHRLGEGRAGEPREVAASIPCEDIGLVVVDQPSVTYSHAALARLVESGAGVVICDRRHLPSGLLLPMAEHTEVVWRLHEQIDCPKPLRKQLWRQLVVAKIRGQAANLEADSPVRRRLAEFARNVRSGDPDNLEAQAAKSYWQAWLPDFQRLPPDGTGWLEPAAFRRDADGADAVNVQLNYGYAILRAAVARALVSAGLHPALGLKHSNRSNAFCLADDFLEPLRPLADDAVRDLYRSGQRELNKFAKAKLLSLLTSTVRLDGFTGPLMVALHRMAASYVRCLEGESKRLLLPEWAEQEETQAAETEVEQAAGETACT